MKEQLSESEPDVRYCSACRELMRRGRRVYEALDPLLPEFAKPPSNEQHLLIEARECARELIQNVEDGQLRRAEEQLDLCGALLRRAQRAR